VKRWRGIVVPAALLVLAELAFCARSGPSDSLASPSHAIATLWAALTDASLFVGTAQTLGALLAGLVLGGFAGLAAGIALGASDLLRRLTFLTIEMLRPIPSVALLPLSLLIFGFGYRMEIAVIAFATFWPSLILTQSAVTQIEPRLIEVARILRLSRLQTVLKIILPAAAPRLMTALRLAAGLALVVAVTAEIVSNPQGLGHDLMIAQETLRPERMFAVLFWVGLIGWGKNAALLRLERWLFAHRGEVDTSVAT
jgi:ABC-type nitrate/sulfonate/bicarbonate transport system permease component